MNGVHGFGARDDRGTSSGVGAAPRRAILAKQPALDHRSR